MRRHVLGLFATSLLIPVGAGCNGGGFSFSYHDRRPVKVWHVHTHVCTEACDHCYYDGVKFVALEKGHRHGPGCGHVWNGKHWVLAEKGKARRPAPVAEPPRKQIKRTRRSP